MNRRTSILIELSLILFCAYLGTVGYLLIKEEVTKKEKRERLDRHFMADLTNKLLDYRLCVRQLPPYDYKLDHNDPGRYERYERDEKLTEQCVEQVWKRMSDNGYNWAEIADLCGKAQPTVDLVIKGYERQSEKAPVGTK